MLICIGVLFSAAQPNPQKQQKTKGQPKDVTSLLTAQQTTVFIPAGCFMMGTSGGSESETPVHKVCLNAYQMDLHEVTQGEYRAFVGEIPQLKDGSCFVYRGSIPENGIVNPSTLGSSKPAVCVSKSEAQAYCESLGKRLPTEAEWEYAAKGGPYAFPAMLLDKLYLDSVAWHVGNSMMQIHEVCTQKKNPLGLCDMNGNASEWTADRYRDYSRAPDDSSGYGELPIYTIRGGGFVSEPNLVRSEARDMGSGDLRVEDLGFRCAKSVSE